MLHSEALQVPGTVQALEGRGKSGGVRSPDPPHPGIPAPGQQCHPNTTAPEPHLPPLPELLFHQSADTKLLVHLLQKLGL